MLKVTLLNNDNVRRRNFFAEHGLSMLIETADCKILFDTGQTSLFHKNAMTLGLDLTQINAVVISHGHYDHTGGIPEFCRINSQAPIYAHPEIFSKKWKAPKKCCIDEREEIGIPWDFNSEGISAERFQFHQKPVHLRENILLSSTIPTVVGFEEFSGNLLVQGESGVLPDRHLDEQFMLVVIKDHAHLILGCGHRGVANSIEYAKKLLSGKKLVSLIGGMHLENIPKERLERTVHYLRQSGIQTIIPLHCTGFDATVEIKKAFGPKCMIHGTGDTIELG